MMEEFFKGKTCLVTGGTGSIGSEIVRALLQHGTGSIRVFSNSENEIWEAKQRFAKDGDRLRFLLGDVRDFERVKLAADGVDLVFHAAAIKHVPISEYNPMEAIGVNVLGLHNVVEASILQGVRHLVNISTDKAVSPASVMGATKMIGERLCTSRQLSMGKHQIVMSSVRFGNVLGSRGSIIPVIKDMLLNGEPILLTDRNMRRFFMSVQQAASLVLESMTIARGGEIFVLKMRTIRIKDLFDAVIENHAIKVGMDPSSFQIEEVGPRPGEKIDEELVSAAERPFCRDAGDMLVIEPPTGGFTRGSIGADVEQYCSTRNATPLCKDEIERVLAAGGLI